MAVIIIMPKARGIAALSSASEAARLTRFCMGSQKCTDNAAGSTRKDELGRISPDVR
jgi:hypothetical protein